ncbi:MAG: immunoglobulin domain-containing protein [Verrucomicrobiota bacterium]|jgi:hypothetical protein
MKTKVLQAITVLGSATGLWMAGPAALAQTSPNTVAVTAPSIISQPASQTVDYASDVIFSVMATGTPPLSYQWRRNGVDLADFDNVAGATTATLELVGVADNDAGRYTVVVSNEGGAVTSSVAPLAIRASLKFTDNFALGMTNWQALLDSTPLTLAQLGEPLAGGGFGLLATNPAQQVYHNLAVKYACRVVLTFWMYDDGSALAACGQLRGYTGPGYGKYVSPFGGLWQELVIGKCNAAFGTNGTTGTLRGATLDTTKYQGRVLRGANAGWFNLDAAGAPGRSVGWHTFQIDRAAAGYNSGAVRFYVDGVLARTILGADAQAIDSLVLGSIDAGPTDGLAGQAWFAQVKVEAYPGLFDWQTLDSSGRDLFPDWMKLREVGTTTTVLASATPYTLSEINVLAPNNSLGTWTAGERGIYCESMRGDLEYAFSAPAADAYRIEVEGRERNFRSPVVDLPLMLWLDGESLGRFNLPYGPQANGLVHCFTPFIQPGPHTLRIHWDNVGSARSLYLKAVRLQAVASPYVSGDGMKVWVANRLAAQSGVEFAPSSSPVSPVCVEGRGQYLSMMTLLAGPEYPLSPVPIQPGAGHRWYANVPLSVGAPTLIETSHQNGGVKETNEINWQVTDLLQPTNYAASLMLRQGDALLFNAAPAGATNGEVTISVASAGAATNAPVADLLTTDAATPVAYQFNQPGAFTVTGTYLPTGASGSITVNVVAVSLDSIAARMHRWRYWICTNLPPGTVLEPDPRLKLIPVSAAERTNQTPALPPLQPNECDYRVRTRATDPRQILARLGTNGPVLAGATVQGFCSWGAADTYLRLIDTNPDGSQLIETAFVVYPLPPGLTVEVKIIVSGVTFDDGTVTKTLTPADFDSLGICRLRFIRAAGVKTSVCHTFHLYDQGTLVSYQ